MNHIKEYVKAIADLGREYQREVELMTRQVEARDLEILDLETRLKSAEAKLIDKQDYINALKEDLVALEKRVAGFEAEKNQLRRTQEPAGLVAQVLAKDIIKIDGEKDELKSKLERLQYDFSLLDSFINNLAEAYSEHRHDVTGIISQAQENGYHVNKDWIIQRREHRFASFPVDEGTVRVEYDTFTTTLMCFDKDGNTISEPISCIYSDD